MTNTTPSATPPSDVEERWSVHLADPTGQIERECADKAMHRRDVAVTYALAIRDERIVPVLWGRANEAIRARWSAAGLEWIKKLAWAYVEGKKTP